MYASIGITLVAAALALVLVYLDRKGRSPGALWLTPPLVALLPQLAHAAFKWGRIPGEVSATHYPFREGREHALRVEVFQTTEVAFWSCALVATLVMLFLAFGRSGDGRAVSWGNAVMGLAGVVVLGIVSPVLSAWLAPLIVLGVAVHAMPKAKSLFGRRVMLALTGGVALVAANVALFIYDRQANMDWGMTGSIVWTFDMLPLLTFGGLAIGAAVVASMFVRS